MQVGNDEGHQGPREVTRVVNGGQPARLRDTQARLLLHERQ